MPVIINDFDIMTDSTEPPPSRGANAEETATETKKPQLRPEEITQVVRVSRERMERVRAD